jgi:flavorubredoxin
MSVRKLTNSVYAVGAIDWDRTSFDALVPLPYGTSYNAYLIKGSEKSVLIDTVDPMKLEVLKSNLNYLKVGHLDYIVSNHAEQDHSGSLPLIMELYPTAQLMVNKKGMDILMPLMDLPADRVQVIEDRQKISLGDRNLEFIFAPWVHWPETMFTYLQEDKILFSCDLFGAHLATSQLFASEVPNVLQEAKRYYAEIMLPYGGRIPKHLETLQNYQINIIAPSHGPVYDNPTLILDAYREWVSEKVKNEVIILYISMHGSTEKMAHYLADVLIKRDISIKLMNLETADIGEIALALVDAATVVFASPAVLMGPHPYIVSIAYVINSLKPKTRFIGIMGSFGWGNKLVAQLTELLKDLRAEILEPLLIKGLPRAENFQEIEKFADEIENRHKAISLI